MNLLELRAKYPTLFYTQTWMIGESFMRALPTEGRNPVPPKGVQRAGQMPKAHPLPLAVDLAHAFVTHPDDPIWHQHYFWCDDTDSLGQRIYVGANNGRFEIHRHLALTGRWGIPVWA